MRCSQTVHSLFTPVELTREKQCLEARDMFLGDNRVEQNMKRALELASATVVLFQQKYWLGHPENYLFSISKKLFVGSKYPKNKLFDFDHRSVGDHVFNIQHNTFGIPQDL